MYPCRTVPHESVQLVKSPGRSAATATGTLRRLASLISTTNLPSAAKQFLRFQVNRFDQKTHQGGTRRATPFGERSVVQADHGGPKSRSAQKQAYR